MAKGILKLKGKDKPTFFSPTKGLMSPSAIHNETREKRVCGRFRSIKHMLRKEDLNSAEVETVQVSQNPVTVITAYGEMQTNEEAKVYVKEADLFVTVHETYMVYQETFLKIQLHQMNRMSVSKGLLHLFVTVKLLEDTPAVLSLGRFCEKHGYSFEWTNGQLPYLVKNSRRIQCNTETTC